MQWTWVTSTTKKGPQTSAGHTHSNFLAPVDKHILEFHGDEIHYNSDLSNVDSERGE